MIISPFTPLYFEPFQSDGIESRYIQTFATTDQILIEVLGSNTPIRLLSGDGAPAYSSSVSLEPTVVPVGDTTLRFFILSGLTPGIYRIWLPSLNKTSNFFRITDDAEELANTTLIQYSMKDNRQRNDAVFLIDNMRYFFDFRVPGGFKDSNWTFSVDNEQFVTPQADTVELFALESTQKKFTMGTQEGVPVWFGEMLNRILCCSYVYFDGVRYARKDSAVPEMTVQIEGIDSFVFTQNLQKVNNLNPTIETNNQINVRRVYEPYDPYQSAPDTDEHINSNNRIIR